MSGCSVASHSTQALYEFAVALYVHCGPTMSGMLADASDRFLIAGFLDLFRLLAANSIF